MRSFGESFLPDGIRFTLSFVEECVGVRERKSVEICGFVLGVMFRVMFCFREMLPV